MSQAAKEASRILQGQVVGGIGGDDPNGEWDSQDWGRDWQKVSDLASTIKARAVTLEDVARQLARGRIPSYEKTSVTNPEYAETLIDAIEKLALELKEKGSASPAAGNPAGLVRSHF